MRRRLTGPTRPVPFETLAEAVERPVTWESEDTDVTPAPVAAQLRLHSTKPVIRVEMRGRVVIPQVDSRARALALAHRIAAAWLDLAVVEDVVPVIQTHSDCVTVYAGPFATTVLVGIAASIAGREYRIEGTTD